MSAELDPSPTWVVAAVCSVVVAISVAVERLLHHVGEVLKRKDPKHLYLFEALQKIKEELMLLGFISFVLSVSQNAISKICVPKTLVDNLLPCKFSQAGKEVPSSSSTSHISGSLRRLLGESSSAHIVYCAHKVI